MTEFGNSKLRRQIKIFDVEQPVQIEIDRDGIYFWIQGSKKAVFLSWFQAVQASTTPENVPSFLMGKPLEFLKNTAAKVVKREAAKTASGKAS